MKILSRHNLLVAVMLLTAILAAVGLVPRLRAENSNKTVAFAIEYKDVNSLAVQNRLSSQSVWEKIQPFGVEGICVSEYTGEELSLINPLPVEYGPAEQLGIKKDDGAFINRASILIDKTSKYAAPLYEYIKIKMPMTEKYEIGNSVAIVLPGNMEDFKLSSFMPDFLALDFCKEHNIPVLFRPGPCPASDGKSTSDAFRLLLKHYPQIKTVVPAGMIMAGYPDYKQLAETMTEEGITLSQAEFVKQIGVSEFATLVEPNVIPLHSLTKDEIISRNITRRQIAERFVRAVHERSVRFVMMRPYDLQMGNKLSVFIEDLKTTREAIAMRGYVFGWPSHIPQWPAPLAGAIACALSIVFCGWFYWVRMNNIESKEIKATEILALIFISSVVAAAIWKIPAAARLLGGFCGAFVATEAALTALESDKRPVSGAITGLFIIIAGGLSIASFYGTTSAALRLTPFSGVKLTLLLPPLLLLIHDFKRRIHPESIGEIVARPAMWGELFILGIMMLALLIMALRSDNVSNVPTWEVSFRDFIERILLVRPRTKEFLIGYPALVFYWYLVRMEWLPHYREAIRVAAMFAFCSAVNTFCHFHTLLYLSIIRILNGWWLGLLIGITAVAAINYLLLPLLKHRPGVMPN
jgi:hypothetical protein